jgi:tetratricopeptide (TPR) repeat protein
MATPIESKFDTPAVSERPEATAIDPFSNTDGPIMTAANEGLRRDASPTPLEPQSAADRLLLAAHDAAAVAESEAEMSQIIETCRRARASQPTPPVARYANELAAWAINRRGQIKAEGGRGKEALLDFDDAIRLDARCWRALHNRGVLYAQEGNFEQAFEDFNQTIEIKPEFAKAYSNRAALFVVAGDLMPALDDYARAIELDPNLAVAHRGRGRACHFLGQLDEAADHYDAAVQLSPDDSYAIASRADLLTDIGRYQEAARQYERAIQLDPQSSYAHRGAAWLLATCPDESVRDAARALKHAETAIRLDGKEDSIAIDTLAAAQASNGDFAMAMETLGKAIDIAPDNEREAYNERLMMYQQARAFRIAPMRPVAQASYQRVSR